MTRHARVFIACIALTACADASTRDMTAPDAGAATRDTAARPIAHTVVRANGKTFTARGVQASLRAKAFDGPSAVPAAVTLCDAGVIDPDGSPEGGLTGGTYSDVQVPVGAVCVLQDVTVTNSVKAFSDSRLFIRNSQIGGSVKGLNASAVQVSEETHIAGNMNIQTAHDNLYASCAVDNATIDGDLTCGANNPGSPIIRAEQGPTVIGGSIHIDDNVIPDGNVLLLLSASIGADAGIHRNTGAGFKEVSGNTVVNKLGCKNNDPTFTGGPNTAAKKKGQCF